MALPRFVKNFYIWKKGSSSFQQEQLVASTFDLANYNRTAWARESYNFGQDGKIRIDSPASMRRFNPPDTFIGKIFNYGEYVSQSLFSSFINLCKDKVNNGDSGVFSLMRNSSLASTDQIILGSTGTLNTSNKLVCADIVFNIITNSVNPQTHYRFITFRFSGGFVVNSVWNGSHLDTYASETNNTYISSDGNFNWTLFESQLLSAFANLYTNLKTTSLTLSTGMNRSSTTFTSRNLTTTLFPLTCIGFHMVDFPTERVIATDGSNPGTIYGTWTQSGTIDPTDPGETPTPPVPPGPSDPPAPPFEPDPDDPITPPGLPDIGGANLGFFSVYNPTETAMRLVAQTFWTTNILDQIKLYFNNPMETIMGFGIVPVKPEIGSSSHIMFGMTDSGVSAPVVTSEYKIVDCGSRPLHTYYGSYLDFEPYTEISMYLPYIGEVEMNPDEMMGRTIGVLYYVNVISGDIVAMVTADGTIIYTAASNCFRQLPLSQYDMSQIIHSAIAAVEALGMGLVKAGAAAATAGVGGGAIQSAAGYGASDSQVNSAAFQAGAGTGPSMLNAVMSAKRHYQRAGRIGTGSGQLSYQKPYMVVLRPNLMLPDGAGDVGTNSDLKAYEGYPCNQIVTMSSLHGMTVVEASRLAISGATANEIDEIMAMLKEGVIF